MDRFPFILLLCCFFSGLAFADPVDWGKAEQGMMYGDKLAYAGCAEVKKSIDITVLKIAVMRAQANIVRCRNVMISGEEHLVKDNGSSGISTRIIETSGDVLNKPEILNQEIVIRNGVSALCVLVSP